MLAHKNLDAGAEAGREASRRKTGLRTGETRGVADVHQAGAKNEVRLRASPVQIQQAVPHSMDAAGLEWRIEGTELPRGSKRVHLRFQTEPARQAVPESAATVEPAAERSFVVISLS